VERRGGHHGESSTCKCRSRSLTGGRLGYAEILAVGTDGRPTQGVITIDRLGGRSGLVHSIRRHKATPRSPRRCRAARSVPPPVRRRPGGYDLYSFVCTKWGTCLALPTVIRFCGGSHHCAERLAAIRLQWRESRAGTDGEHLNQSATPDALMNGYLAPGVRETPSALEGTSSARRGIRRTAGASVWRAELRHGRRAARLC